MGTSFNQSLSYANALGVQDDIQARTDGANGANGGNGANEVAVTGILKSRNQQHYIDVKFALFLDIRDGQMC